MFDVTGLKAVPMRKANNSDWRGCYYVLKEDHSVCIAKTCFLCREILPAEEFGMVLGRKFDLNSTCQTCNRVVVKRRGSSPASDGNGTRSSEDSRNRRIRNNARSDDEVLADQKRKRPSGEKRCQTCRITRPLTEFSSDRGRGDGLTSSCKTCWTVKSADRHTRAFIAYWEANNIPLRCYICDGPFEEIEHLIPTSLPHGDPGPINTRPACWTCNRGQDGKGTKPLEEYIFSVNHPTKTRAKILHEIVMSGTWPFALTTPEEFIAQSREYSDI